MFRDGARRIVQARDLISGATIANISRIGIEAACQREVDGGEPGVHVRDVLDAIGEELATAVAALTPANCHRFISGLPQDLAVVRVEPVVRKVRRPHRYVHAGVREGNGPRNGDRSGQVCETRREFRRFSALTWSLGISSWVSRTPKAPGSRRRADCFVKSPACLAGQVMQRFRVRLRNWSSGAGAVANQASGSARRRTMGSSRTFEDPRDHDRRFLPTNGGCCYIDLDHLEIALPETWSAFEHVAYWRAMLGVARQAMVSANKRMPDGRRIQVLANCSDGLGHSYGSHTNVLVTKAAWENIFHRKPHYLAYLAAFQTSSIVFTGQGKVSGGENGKPA